MRYRDGTLVYAPTDLSSWISSPYASWMSRYAIENRDEAPAKDEPDAMLSRLASRGLAHEDALEQQFIDQGLQVVNVAKQVESAATGQQSSLERHEAAISLTRELITSGADVIAQASLQHDSFSGFADFLVKVGGQSSLGNFHYEVWDTKLARRVKPGMVLQLCCYVDMLEQIQGMQANNIVVALGNGANESISLVDCFDYYLAVKRAFLDDHSLWSADAAPNPADHVNHGDWSGHAQVQLEAIDHLSLVARITRRQIERLEHAGINTMAALADASDTAVAGISPSQMDWLVRQATLQCASASKDTPEFHVLEPSANSNRGIAALPAASQLDVFLDIEGFPLEGEGLEYLWGCTYFDSNGERAFCDWWAHDTRAEQRAFEGFIDWAYARWREDPTMHIYHYAPYEITACKRMMGTYGTRETELDDLLRNNVFVDLYSVVTHGLQIGEPRYSIKNVERLYRSKRGTDVASGGDSVVVYDLWREAWLRGEDSDDWNKSEVLASIREYNRDDCDSTQELCEWLRQHRQQLTAAAPIEHTPETELSDIVAARHALRDRLLLQADLPTTPEAERTLLATLAGVLEFHRREEKNAWWRFFERMDPANTQLADDPNCIADCKRTQREPYKHKPKVRNLSYEYVFDIEQESRGISSTVTLKGGEPDENGRFLTGSVLRAESDLANGRIVIQCKNEPPEFVSLVPDEIVRADPIPAAIDAVVADIESGATERSALLDFLQRKPPRRLGGVSGDIVQSPDNALEETISAVCSLDDSCLIIQGPPGAGKSYTGARVIAALVAQGKRVGIASNSHAAINNLLIGAARYCIEENIDASFVCTKNTSDDLEQFGATITNNGKLADHLQAGCVIGTTAWGFSREDLTGAFDVLIVDEAGQVAVANLVAMSRAASNLVLMGDQRQLGQPTQGVHPAESGLSVLDYRLGDIAAVDPAHGVFLGTTFRMHPKINEMVSKYVYTNRLGADATTSVRELMPATEKCLIKETSGIVFLPVEHQNNTQESDEEVDLIVDAVNSLIGRPLVRKDGSTQEVTLADMLFVAPYNAQATKLQLALGSEARVGSVDRFQGQEAPIVFLSMCSSDASSSPRGVGFLFDRNRLNVAVSRAETLFVIVGQPQLAVTPVSSLSDLKRVNFVAALMNDG